VPYWRLSAFYLAFFSTLGALLPYWSLYLESRGLGPARIGALMAVLMATKVIAPNLWAWLADRSGARLGYVRLAAWLAAAAFALVEWVEGFAALAAVMVLFGFFWNATLPQFEAVTLNHLGPRPERYTGIRLWGSVGFIVAVLALGPLIERLGLTVVPAAVLVALLGVALASLAAPEAVARARGAGGERLAAVLARPRVLAFLAACLLMQASHAPYYVLFSIYLRDHGYPAGVIGALWALGVIAEVVLFWRSPRLFARCSLRALFLASFALTALRWLLVAGFADWIVVLAAAQLLHAATFGLYHACAIQIVHREFTGAVQGRGQALYSSLSFGVGGALGSLAGGALWEGAGPLATWLAAALAAALAWLLVWRWVRPVGAAPTAAR